MGKRRTEVLSGEEKDFWGSEIKWGREGLKCQVGKRRTEVSSGEGKDRSEVSSGEEKD